jgi:2-dehydro-3-deoxyphosphooctonate aldolase (KDO 8-P synthase)
MRIVEVADIKIGGDNPPLLIAGPCVIESESSALRHAKELKAIARRSGFSFIYKSSFDKANRTSVGSYRGPGLKKGLDVLRKIKSELKVAVLSDVHCREEIKEAAKVLDVIQIPAFLCRQTDLIIAAAKTGRAVNIKKGQFLAPWDMANVIKKAESAGNKDIMLTERGASFGYNNLVSDFRAIPVMRAFGYPVIYDATHSVQMPGGMGSSSGGDRKFVGCLAMASAACGADGLFVEAHEDPDRAPSDGPNMVKLSELEAILKKVKKVREAVS